MIRNIILSALASLKRKKMVSLFTILTISLGMVLVILIGGIYHSYTGNIGPYLQRDKCLFLSNISFVQDGKIVQRFHKHSTASFIDKYLRKLKTPEYIGLYRGVDNVEWSLGSRFKAYPVRYMETDANFWKILQFNFISGRPFLEEEVKSNQKVCIISRKAALYLFNETNVVGKYFDRYYAKYRIIGVIENEHPQFDVAADFYVPYTRSVSDENYSRFDKDLNRDVYQYRGSFKGIVQVHEKSDIKIVKSEFDKLIHKINQRGQIEEFDQINTSLKTATQLISELPFLSRYKIPFSLLLLLIILVLLIPIVILSNINMYSFRERMEEVGIKRAFGAKRLTMFIQFLTENIIITILGSLIAIFISIPLFQFLSYLLFQTTDIEGFKMSWSIVVFLVIGSLGFGFLTGVVPIARISRVDPVKAIHDSERSGDNNINFRLRKKWIQVVTYFLLFMILSLSCSLLVYYYSVSLSPLGYQTKNLLNVAVWEEGSKQGWKDQYNAERFEGFKERLLHINGVEDVSYVLNTLPFYGGTGFQNKSFLIEGVEKQIPTMEVDTCFFDILQMQPEKGELFNSKKDLENFLPAVVTRIAEKEYFNNNAIGKVLYLKGSGKRVKIMGVIKKYRMHTYIKESSGIIICRNKPSRCVLIRCSQNTDLQDLEKSIDKTIKEQLSNKFWYNKSGAIDEEHNKLLRKTLPTFYGILLVMLFLLMNALLGYFTLIYYNVKIRKKELGIRRAIGATQSSIYLKIVVENLVMMLVGSVFASIIVYQLRIIVLDSYVWQYFGIGILFALGIALVTTIISALFPAFMAGKVNPVEALAEE